jgi:hypothetical protein
VVIEDSERESKMKAQLLASVKAKHQVLPDFVDLKEYARAALKAKPRQEYEHLYWCDEGLPWNAFDEDPKVRGRKNEERRAALDALRAAIKAHRHFTMRGIVMWPVMAVDMRLREPIKGQLAAQDKLEKEERNELARLKAALATLEPSLARLPRCEREVKVKVAVLPDPPHVKKSILNSLPDDRRYKAPVDSARFHRFSQSQQFTRRSGSSPPPSSTLTSITGGATTAASGGYAITTTSAATTGGGSGGGGGAPQPPTKQPKAVKHDTGPILSEEERQRRRDENVIKYWKWTNERALVEARYMYRSHQFGTGKR